MRSTSDSEHLAEHDSWSTERQSIRGDQLRIVLCLVVNIVDRNYFAVVLEDTAIVSPCKWNIAQIGARVIHIRAQLRFSYLYFVFSANIDSIFSSEGRAIALLRGSALFGLYAERTDDRISISSARRVSNRALTYAKRRLARALNFCRNVHLIILPPTRTWEATERERICNWRSAIRFGYIASLHFTFFVSVKCYLLHFTLYTPGAEPIFSRSVRFCNNFFRFSYFHLESRLR